MTRPEIVLWDVMGTLVHDPFYDEVPAFFGQTLSELLAVKHPHAWDRCERGDMSVEDMERSFFADGREYDVQGLRDALRGGYRLLPGIEALLNELHSSSTPMFVVSNYTPWYSMIEEAVTLSRWMEWRFVSCDIGVRKPEADYYRTVLRELGVTASQCVFIDDRASNCDAAQREGMASIRFETAVATRTALAKLGVLGP